MKESRKELSVALALCFLATALLFGRILADPALAILFRDTGTFSLPAKHVLLDSLRRFGEIPLWNPFPLCGVPFLADPSMAALFPLNALLLPFSSLTYGFSWYLAAHFPLAFAGFWLYARARKVPYGYASLLAVLAAFSGPLVSLVHIPGPIGAWAGVGWLLWAWHRWQETGRTWLLFLSSLFLAWPLYAGDPQAAIVLALLFLPAATAGTLALRARKLAVLGALSALASAPVLLPAAELLPSTVRAGGIEGPDASSLHPLRLVELVFRLPFGASLLEESEIGRFLNGPEPIPFIFSLYLGALFLPLLAAGLRRGRETTQWLALAGFVLLLSLGTYSPLPLNAALRAALPLWSSFRYPERLFPFVALALWLSLACSLARGGLNGRRFLGGLGAAGVVTVLALVTGFPSPRSLGVHSLLVLLAAGGITYLLRGKKLSGHLAAALALLCACDLSLGLHPLLWTVPAKVAADNWPPFTKLVPRARSLEEIPRFYNLDETRVDGALLGRLLPEGTVPQRLSVQPFLSLSSNTGSLFGLGTPLGFVTFLDRRHSAFWPALGGGEKAFSLKGARYIGRMTELGAAVTENPAALPLFSVPARVRFAPDDEAALRTLAAPDFPFASEVVVTGKGKAAGGTAVAKVTAAEAAKVTALRRTYRLVELEVVAASPFDHWLFWNETYSRHWRADVGTETVAALPANHWAMAFPLRLPAGTHRVTLRYANPWIAAGAALFVAWLVLFAAFTVPAARGLVKRKAKRR